MPMKAKKRGTQRKNLYQTMYAYSKKNLQANILTGIVALVLAFLATLLGNVLACVVSLISLFISGGATTSKILQGIKHGKVDDSVLIFIAVIVSFFLGQFTLAATAMAIYKLATVLIIYLSGRVGISMMHAAEVLPAYANLVDTDATIRKIPVTSVTRGMKIIVKTGEIVPADSIILDGCTEFDTSSVYYSEENISFSTGDKILAGFVNKGTSVTCKVLYDSANSVVSKMKKIAAHAEKGSTKGEKRFSAIAKWYPSMMLLLAVAVLIVIPRSFSSGALSIESKERNSE